MLEISLIPVVVFLVMGFINFGQLNELMRITTIVLLVTGIVQYCKQFKIEIGALEAQQDGGHSRDYQLRSDNWSALSLRPGYNENLQSWADFKDQMGGAIQDSDDTYSEDTSETGDEDEISQVDNHNVGYNFDREVNGDLTQANVGYRLKSSNWSALSLWPGYNEHVAKWNDPLFVNPHNKMPNYSFYYKNKHYDKGLEWPVHREYWVQQGGQPSDPCKYVQNYDAEGQALFKISDCKDTLKGSVDASYRDGQGNVKCKGTDNYSFICRREATGGGDGDKGDKGDGEDGNIKSEEIIELTSKDGEQKIGRGTNHSQLTLMNESNLSLLRFVSMTDKLKYREPVELVHNIYKDGQNVPRFVKYGQYLQSHYSGPRWRTFYLLDANDPNKTGNIKSGSLIHIWASEDDVQEDGQHFVGLVKDYLARTVTRDKATIFKITGTGKTKACICPDQPLYP